MAQKIAVANDEINHQAYMDVLDCLPPTQSTKEYLDCYHAWSNIAGERHFDPHF